MELTTKRLKIREWQASDVNGLRKQINSLNVSQYLLVVPYPYTKKDASWWVSHNQKEAKKKPRASYNFAIELQEEKKLIGGIGLSHVDTYNGTCEVGFWLGEDYWGKGYMSEAIEQIIEMVFRKLKLRRIHWNVYVENTASIRLAEKFGFSFEGTGKKQARSKATGKIHDEKHYALLKEDWQKHKKKM